MNWTSIFLISASLLGPCNSNQNEHEKKNEDSDSISKKTINPPDENLKSKTSKNTTAPNKSFDLIITFSSRGEGINGDARKSLDEYIKHFESNKNVQINYHMKSWGREGETDYCFNLSNLNSTDQNDFVSQAKELLKSANLVSISENKNCN
jgi:hypothetical protein